MSESNVAVAIRVQADDIANGVPGHPDSCPIALAATRAGIVKPSVGEYEIDSLAADATTEDVYLPVEAVGFIGMFDTGQEVSPFEFTVEVPASWLDTSTVAVSESVAPTEADPC